MIDIQCAVRERWVDHDRLLIIVGIEILTNVCIDNLFLLI